MKHLSEYICDDFNLKGKRAKIKTQKDKPEIRYKPTTAAELFNIIEAKENEWHLTYNTGNSIFIGTESNPLDLNDIDFSDFKGNALYYVFENNRKLRYLDITYWDVKNIKNFDNMFANCTNLISIGDISNWDMSNAETAKDMFNGCENLIEIGDISNWSIDKLYNMGYMFNNCEKLINIGDLSNWNTSNLTYMSYAFHNCKKITSLGNLNTWDVQKVYDSRLKFCNNHKNFAKSTEQKRKLFVTQIRSSFLGSGIKENNIPDWAKLNNVRNIADQLVK